MNTTITPLAVTSLRPGTNDRTTFRDDDLRTLADSIATHGLVQAITVRPALLTFICPSCYQPCEVRSAQDPYSAVLEYCCPEHGVVDAWETTYEIVAGERRWRAHLVAELPTINAMVGEYSDEEASNIMLLENVLRVDITPFEEARAYQKRIDQFGISVREVAKRANRKASHVKKRIDLLSLITDIERLTVGGSFPLSYAEALTPCTESEQRAIVAQLTKSEHLPNLTRFRETVSVIIEQRAQTALFDLEDFWQQQATSEGKRTIETGLSVDQRLPKMAAQSTDNVGRATRKYIDQLSAQGHDDAALTVSTVLDQLVRLNYTSF